MAKSRTTLKQRIALESGDQIEAELRKIGKTGEAALKAIGDAPVDFGDKLLTVPKWCTFTPPRGRFLLRR